MRFTDLPVLAHQSDPKYNETLTLVELPNGDFLLLYTFDDEEPEAQHWEWKEKANVWDAFQRRAEAMRETEQGAEGR
ncbi:hypothetical protein [Spirillospora sp. CA-294931]|uniref:hypothetical protein n=1 Tax=Spirillospora sp. CA-294931 TaxID=3240042 RepID=UPI003D8E8C8D